MKEKTSVFGFAPTNGRFKDIEDIIGKVLFKWKYKESVLPPMSNEEQVHYYQELKRRLVDDNAFKFPVVKKSKIEERDTTASSEAVPTPRFELKYPRANYFNIGPAGEATNPRYSSGDIYWIQRVLIRQQRGLSPFSKDIPLP